MKAEHSLLRRQLRRHFGDSEGPPAGFEGFLEAIDEAYRQSDEDRRMLERSLDLSSQELGEANTDLRAVMEDFLDLYFRVDSEGIILDCRVGRSGSLLLPDRDLIGRPLQSIPEPTVAKLFSEALLSVKQTGSLKSFSYTLPSTGAGETYYTASLIPLHGRQIAVAVQDDTEMRRTKQRELELRDRLAAAERMESLGLLAGGVAHDLNNILGPLVAYPDLIREAIDDQASVLRDLDAMKQAALRAAAVIQDLLTMARRGVPAMEPVDLNRVVQKIVGSPSVQELSQSQPNTELRLDLDPDLPLVEASEHRLGQAILNLVLNALEATPDGGTVSITTFATTEDVDRRVALHVDDTGCGIAANDLEHIFEPFYSKKKLGRSGSGLGLAVVWGVVQDLGGAIDVTSNRQRTRFTVQLPPSPTQGFQPRVEAKVVGGTERLLVVDDVEPQRTLAARLLTSLGYQVTVAANGREAIGMLAGQPVDLLVLDMVMEEGFDGLDTWRAAREAHPDLRCIIASGYAESDRIRLAWNEGAGVRVQKPYSRDELARAVRSELDR